MISMRKQLLIWCPPWSRSSPGRKVTFAQLFKPWDAGKRWKLGGFLLLLRMKAITCCFYMVFMMFLYWRSIKYWHGSVWQCLDLRKNVISAISRRTRLLISINKLMVLVQFFWGHRFLPSASWIICAKVVVLCSTTCSCCLAKSLSSSDSCSSWGHNCRGLVSFLPYTDVSWYHSISTLNMIW